MIVESTRQTLMYILFILFLTINFFAIAINFKCQQFYNNHKKIPCWANIVFNFCSAIKKVSD